jgi:cytochrome c oxidase subunit II
MKHHAKFGAALAALAMGLAPAAMAQDPVPWQLNLGPGVTETAAAAYRMHMIMLWICIVIGVLVFGAMFVAMFKFRHSKGAKADVTLLHSTKVEILWTVVPVLILIAMAIPATKTLIFMADTRDADMVVKVTGYQWKWRYEIVEYRGQAQNVNFMSTLDAESNRVRFLKSGLDPNTVQQNGKNVYLLNVDRELVLPTDTKVRFLFTADDVIHAWWVPSLGWKQDAIPGFINEAWTDIKVPGTYRGQCTELCGKDHAFMPIVVRAVPRAEFEQWLTQNQRPAEPGTAIASAPAPAPVKG